MRWLFVAVGVAVLGAVVVLSGVVPARASSGHWAVTELVLDFAKKRSVATNSLGLELPPLDAGWLVVRGAGHFEGGCFPCHGSPSVTTPRIARAMTPHPPPLAETVPEYSAEELFYIVKHGIKFTGMPAWPAQERDDEVHAVVAFLLAYPRLDAQAYRALVDGEAGVDHVVPLRELEQPAGLPAAILHGCARCHGADGQGRGSQAFPALAGQGETALFNAMEAYASGRRPSGIMTPIAAGLDARTWRALARHYAGLPRRRPSPAPLKPRGQRIATEGLPGQGVPACRECHGPAEHPRNAAYPELSGQYAGYLVEQLALFKAGTRGGSPYGHLMRHVAPGLSREDMEAVAAYYEATE